MRRSHNSLEDQERNNAPLVEIFGGLFALLLVLFLLLNQLSQIAAEEQSESLQQNQTENRDDEGLYKIGWGAYGAGYVVIAFPQELRIVETGQAIAKGRICAANSPFRDYALRTYRSGPQQQVIFALLEGSTATMAEARNCLIELMPHRALTVGWIIADNELLKSVSLKDIPLHIKKTLQ